MGKVIAVANQKGGVGKSTTVVNLAAYLGSRDKKILCIDIDAQGNTTTGFGIKKRNVGVSAYDILIGKAKISDAILETEFKNVSIVPATADLAGAEVELIQMEHRFQRLKMQILTCKEQYDYIFVDCPPALGLLTLNGLTAADEILVSMLAEYFALEGLTQLVQTIRLVRTNYNPALEICGILFTMYDARLNVSEQVVDEVKKYFPGKVFETKIPRNVRLSEAPSYGKPVMYYDKNSKGATSYEMLGHEILGESIQEPKKHRIFFGRGKK